MRRRTVRKPRAVPPFVRMLGTLLLCATALFLALLAAAARRHRLAAAASAAVPRVESLADAARRFPVARLRPHPGLGATNGHPSAFVLSAFLDTRPLARGGAPALAVLAAFHRLYLRKNPPLRCALRTRGGAALSLPAVVVRDWKPHISGPDYYVSALVECALGAAPAFAAVFGDGGEGHWDPPERVTLAASAAAPGADAVWLPVALMPHAPLPPAHPLEAAARRGDGGGGARGGAGAPPPPPLGAAACSAPLRGDLYGDTLGHWVAALRAAGVGHVLLYNASASGATSAAAARLAADPAAGVAVVQWDLFGGGEGEGDSGASAGAANSTALHLFAEENAHLWYHGQWLAAQDCALRAAGRARWAAALDPDEFVVGRRRGATPPRVGELAARAAAAAAAGAEPAAEWLPGGGGRGALAPADAAGRLPAAVLLRNAFFHAECSSAGLAAWPDATLRTPPRGVRAGAPPPRGAPPTLATYVRGPFWPRFKQSKAFSDPLTTRAAGIHFPYAFANASAPPADEAARVAAWLERRWGDWAAGDGPTAAKLPPPAEYLRLLRPYFERPYMAHAPLGAGALHHHRAARRGEPRGAADCAAPHEAAPPGEGFEGEYAYGLDYTAALWRGAGGAGGG